MDHNKESKFNDMMVKFKDNIECIITRDADSQYVYRINDIS